MKNLEEYAGYAANQIADIIMRYGFDSKRANQRLQYYKPQHNAEMAEIWDKEVTKAIASRNALQTTTA